MAITRAQQFRQMLEDGGMLVKPGKGKRPGYRGDAAARSTGAQQSGRADPGPRGDPGDRTSPSDRPDYTAPSGFKDPISKSGLKKAKEFRKQQEDARRDRATERANFAKSLAADKKRAQLRRAEIARKKGFFNFQDFVRRTKDANLASLGQVTQPFGTVGIGGFQVPTGIGAIGDAVYVNPDTDFFDVDSLREIASTLTTTQGGLKKQQTKDLKDLRQDIDFQDRLNRGEDIPFEEKQAYINRNKNLLPKADGPSDPCLGPNPPPYCFIGKKADETVAAQNAIARNLGGLSPRIGGSIFDFTGMAEGGIVDMAREEMFLGGVVKGIKKGLKSATRAIKKVAKSPFGKAAILGAIGFGIPGTGFKGLLSKGAMKDFLFKGGEIGLKNLTPKGVASLIGGASLLAGAMTPKEEDEFDIEAYYAANRLNPNPDLFPRILGSQFTQTAADGGRIGYADGTIEAGAMMSKKEMKKLAKSPLYKGFKKMYGIDPSMAKENPAYDEKFKAFEELFKKGFQDGGRIGAQEGGIMPRLNQLSGNVSSAEQMLQQINQRLQSAESSLGSGGGTFMGRPLNAMSRPENNAGPVMAIPASGGQLIATGAPQIDVPPFMRPGNIPGTDVPFSTLRGGPSEGKMASLARSMIGNGFYDLNAGLGQPLGASGIPALGLADGGDVEPVAKKTMPLLDMGGQEMDLRAEGGFVPIGRMEKADDVPARLSKNEFVFTADAVRNAGDGDVDKGAEVMYNMMKNLEDGGNVSEESQGLEGARRMFQTSKRLEEVL